MTPIGIAGLVIALIALGAAVLSPWAVEALTPQKKPIDQIAADLAGQIQDRLAAKAKGQVYVAPAGPKGVDWSKWYPASVIAAGVVATCIGVVGLVAHHDVRLNSATIAVGVSAIVFQYALIIAATLLLILLIGLVLWAIGGK
jgi:hypothetical protein